MSENHVRLVIRSQRISPDEITSGLGLEPDNSYKLGDSFERNDALRKENVWIFNAKMPKQSPIDEQLAWLLNELRPYAGKCLKLSGDADVTISCAGYVHSAPALYFDKQVIAEIHSLGANLYIDLYFMSE